MSEGAEAERDILTLEWCVAEESFLPLEFPVQTNTDRSF